MNPALVLPLLELGKGIVGRLFPDPAEKARAELELLKMTQEGDLKQILAQLEINAKEAAHPSMWVAGWRPGAGWAGVAGLVYAAIGQPLLTWLAAIKGWPAPPAVDAELLLYVLGGMLGLGGLRTFEKKSGVASK
jgi:hypothetical protein